MQGIKVWWAEEGDRRKGETTARALELRSALDGVRRKRGMTGGSHDHPDKYLGVAWRTVRVAVVTSSIANHVLRQCSLCVRRSSSLFRFVQFLVPPVVLYPLKGIPYSASAQVQY